MLVGFARLYVAKVIQFLPLILFISTYRFLGAWETAFYMGGLAALIQTAIFMALGLNLERLLLAINLFLVGGALGMYFKMSWLVSIYDTFMQGTLLIWYAIVGVVSTLFCKTGFLGMEHPNKNLVKKYSWYLVGTTIGLIGWSWYFQGETILAFALSGGLPIAVLITLHTYFVTNIEQS